jgi:hypothetical protein
MVTMTMTMPDAGALLIESAMPTYEVERPSASSSQPIRRQHSPQHRGGLTGLLGGFVEFSCGTVGSGSSDRRDHRARQPPVKRGDT